MTISFILLALAVLGLSLYCIGRALHNPKFIKRHKISLKAIKGMEDIYPPWIYCPVCLERIDYEWLKDGRPREFLETDIFHCDNCDLDLKGYRAG
jgi:hypothetical protein